MSCGLAVASPNGAVVPDRELQINAVINQLGFLRLGKRIQKESTAHGRKRRQPYRLGLSGAFGSTSRPPEKVCVDQNSEVIFDKFHEILVSGF